MPEAIFSTPHTLCSRCKQVVLEGEVKGRSFGICRCPTPMTPYTACSATRYEGSWPKECYRPATVEVEGKLYCPQHAAGRRKSLAAQEKSDRAWKSKWETYNDNGILAERASAALGVTVRALTDYPDSLLVPRDWLLKMVEALEDPS